MKQKVQKTKAEIQAEVDRLKVDLWSNPKRPNCPQVDECEYCGKKLGKNPLYVHVMTNGIIVPNDINEEDINKIGEQSQGCFPIGQGCAKKLFGNQVSNYTVKFEK